MTPACRSALAAAIAFGCAAAPAARAAEDNAATPPPVAAAAYPEAAAPTAEAPAPDYTLTTNVGLFSQYVFRGVSYTQEKPAVQGGADFAHSIGLYLGVWGINISSKAVQNAVGEIDVYGGYATTVGDFGFDVGLLQFIFPDSEYEGTDESYHTLEAYVAVSWKFLKLKYSRTLTDYFGFNNETFGDAGNGDSDGSQYLDLSLNYAFDGGWGVDAHVGHQKVHHYDDYDFTDYRLGVSKDLGAGWKASVGWITTTADSDLYTIDGTDTGANKWVASIVRTF